MRQVSPMPFASEMVVLPKTTASRLVGAVNPIDRRLTAPVRLPYKQGYITRLLARTPCRGPLVSAIFLLVRRGSSLSQNLPLEFISCDLLFVFAAGCLCFWPQWALPFLAALLLVETKDVALHQSAQKDLEGEVRLRSGPAWYKHLQKSSVRFNSRRFGLVRLVQWAGDDEPSRRRRRAAKALARRTRTTWRKASTPRPRRTKSSVSIWS